MVHCFGSGCMRDELVQNYGNPYPVETAIFQLGDGKVAADVTRSLFETAHEYVEGFSVFADKQSFEWNYENEDLRRTQSARAYRAGDRRRAGARPCQQRRRDLLHRL